jgi:hypothetical protein
MKTRAFAAFLSKLERLKKNGTPCCRGVTARALLAGKFSSQWQDAGQHSPEFSDANSRKPGRKEPTCARCVTIKNVKGAAAGPVRKQRFGDSGQAHREPRDTIRDGCCA